MKGSEMTFGEGVAVGSFLTLAVLVGTQVTSGINENSKSIEQQGVSVPEMVSLATFTGINCDNPKGSYNVEVEALWHPSYWSRAKELTEEITTDSLGFATDACNKVMKVGLDKAKLWGSEANDGVDGVAALQPGGKLDATFTSEIHDNRLGRPEVSGFKIYDHRGNLLVEQNIFGIIRAHSE